MKIGSSNVPNSTTSQQQMLPRLVTLKSTLAQAQSTKSLSRLFAEVPQEQQLPWDAASPSLTSPALSSTTASLKAIAGGCLVLALAVVPLLLEVHCLTFFEIGTAIITIDHAVHEDVIATIIRSNETKALVLEELIDNSSWHCVAGVPVRRLSAR